MYFANRMQAGRMLASQISERYQDEPAAVLALSDGGVVVGMQIAMKLRCSIGMLLVDEIELPRELTSIAGISQDGSFSYNGAFSSGEIDEMVSEYRGVIEQKKLEKLHHMNQLIGSGTLIRTDLLKGSNIFLVSDGFTNGFSIDLAMQFLKRIPYHKLIIATPLASIPAIDRMHIVADDIYCLSPTENYITTDHYFDTKDVPEHEVVVATVASILKNWKQPAKS